jgi:hypothetical protein
VSKTDSTNPLGLDGMALGASGGAESAQEEQHELKGHVSESSNPLSLDYTAPSGAGAYKGVASGYTPVHKATVSAQAPPSLPPGAKGFVIVNAVQSGENNNNGEQGAVFITIFP